VTVIIPDTNQKKKGKKKSTLYMAIHMYSGHDVAAARNTHLPDTIHKEKKEKEDIVHDNLYV